MTKKTRDRFHEKPLPPPDRTDDDVTDFTKVVIPAVYNGFKKINIPWPDDARCGWSEEQIKDCAKQIAEDIDFEILKKIRE